MIKEGYNHQANNDNPVIDETLTRFQKIELNEEEKREIHLKMMNSLEKTKPRKKMWDVRPPDLSTVLAGILFIAGGYHFASETIFFRECKATSVK
ncbi:hypothetical protein PY093_13105 [Cytobacillus sp. S13-E01]|uniref:hypothetical protein n=1 Tax=Cytobacillus sp. S13-E01 TaxID=3031326 RepID=UPI0023D7DA43|nr:hypothetical protein [Cytobacillus sp. S13-E01]MDF0727625.1 hypothetical protein [Cytobacillus sp. S13-E01]